MNLGRLTKVADLPDLLQFLADSVAGVDRWGKLAAFIERPALQLIEDALDLFPDDANLWWWRGHALRGLGRFDEAAESFERACELLKDAAVIPHALAETFLEIQQFPRAM